MWFKHHEKENWELYNFSHRKFSNSISILVKLDIKVDFVAHALANLILFNSDINLVLSFFHITHLWIPIIIF